MFIFYSFLLSIFLSLLSEVYDRIDFVVSIVTYVYVFAYKKKKVLILTISQELEINQLSINYIRFCYPFQYFLFIIVCLFQ